MTTAALLTRHALLFTSVIVASIAGCSARQSAPHAPSSQVATNNTGTGAAKAKSSVEVLRSTYPNLSALYSGEAGIYRTCAQNQGVCHNDHEYPNFATLGALVQTIGADCNVARETPSDVHDLCERKGDTLIWGDESIEIGGVIPPKKPKNPNQQQVPTFDDSGNPDIRVRLALRHPPKATKVTKAPRVRIVRESAVGVGVGSSASGFPQRIELGRVTLLNIVKPPMQGAGAIDMRIVFGAPDALKVSVTGMDAFMEDGWGGVSDPSSLHLGDPNGNGVFGAELGGALVVPGKPDKSYLITRLTDPSAGPLMPRANCCSWTKTSLRALYCWISGLAPDGSNALATIDYDRCGPGPRGMDEIDYPEPGAACETSGMCPVMPRAEATSAADADATWATVWKKVLSPHCAGGACHTDRARVVYDLKGEEAAYRSTLEHIVARAPDKSELLTRISPERCREPSCTPMPLKAPPLDAASRALVRRWIERGAPRD